MRILGIESSCDETAAAVVELDMPTTKQPTDVSAGLGTAKQRSKSYMKYDARVAGAVTPPSATNNIGVSSSARKQDVVVCRLLSNVVASSMDLHAKYGGVVPEIAARSHIESIIPVIEKALQDAFSSYQFSVISNQSIDKKQTTDNRQRITQSDDLWSRIDGIAVTHGAGLGGSLLVGVMTARTLAIAKNKPLYAVNHVEAHLYTNFLTEIGSSMQKAISNKKIAKYNLRKAQPEFPILGLIVSGGHTQLVYFRNHFDYDLLGQTCDDAVGEAFDKVAKILGLPYPGGPSVAKEAEKGDPLAYDFPKAKLTGKYDFSFSGLKTAVLRLAQKVCGMDYTFSSSKLPKLLTNSQKANIAASFQRVAIETIVDKTVNAYEEFSPKSMIIGGGVAASQELRRQLSERLPCPIEYPDIKLCTDNGAMIAALGCYKMLLDQKPADPYTLEIKSNLSM